MASPLQARKNLGEKRGGSQIIVCPIVKENLAPSNVVTPFEIASGKVLREFLGLEHGGRLVSSPMSCFKLGNPVELRDKNWQAGMPTPIDEEIVNSDLRS